MTIETIYSEFSIGSTGFIDAVQTHVGIERSNTEISRLADMSPTAAEFMDNWENDDSWTDGNND